MAAQGEIIKELAEKLERQIFEAWSIEAKRFESLQEIAARKQIEFYIKSLAVFCLYRRCFS